VTVGPGPITVNTLEAWILPCEITTKYKPGKGAGLVTTKCPCTVPSEASVHVGLLTGTPVRPPEQSPAVPLKPAPGTDTEVPADPELGERTIFGSTMNFAGVLVVVCVPLGNVVIVSVYPPETHFEPTPTLNVADTVRTVPVPLR
jgi:hypothetical protein